MSVFQQARIRGQSFPTFESMLKIGLTGGIGSGKSTVARLFGMLGVPVFESDLEARKCMAEPAVQAKLIGLFGETILLETGEIDRRKLASLVFSNASKLRELNAVIHPAVGERFKNWCTEQQAPYVIKEAAIVFEHGLEKQLDGVIAVYSPDSVRIPRAAKRLQLSVAEIEQRIANQMPQEEVRRRANWLIFNDEKQMVIPQVTELHQQLLTRAHETA